MDLEPDLTHEQLRAAAPIGTAQHYRWLRWVVVSVLVMNGADAVFTLYWIQSGRASEANPLLDELAHGYPLPFMIAKLAIVSLGTLLLWRLRTQRLAVVGIFAAFLAYYYLFTIHLHGLDLRLWERLAGP